MTLLSRARTLSAAAVLGLVGAQLATGVAAAPQAGSTAIGPSAAEAPERQVALGVSIWNGRRLSELDAFIGAMRGHRPATWTIWSQWGDPATRAFPISQAWAVRARGVTPMIWWEPVDPSDLESPVYARLANIAEGRHDDYVRQYARAARTFGTPLILRFAHEPNGGTFPWGERGFDNDAPTFVAAWRHVHDLFQEEGATNVRFLWSVGRKACPGGCDPYSEFYPGDAYVDYLGFSSFNWGAYRDKWVPMLKGFGRVTRQLSRISTKPIIAVESASDGTGGDKATWIAEGYRRVYEALPQVVAIIYLDVDLRDRGHPDWRLSSPEEALAAYADIAAMPQFQGRLPP